MATTQIQDDKDEPAAIDVIQCHMWLDTPNTPVTIPNKATAHVQWSVINATKSSHWHIGKRNNDQSNHHRNRQLAQSHTETNTTGSNSIFFLTVTQTSLYCLTEITYACIKLNYRPQKHDPNRFRITFSEKLIDPHEVATQMMVLVTEKRFWNSIVSILHEKIVCVDVKSYT